MDIVVCIKRVPMTQEVDLEIDEARKDVRKDALAYVINDWDNYAIEEAVTLQEKLGGTVTAVTVGGEDDEEILRRALAMGADRAVRIDPQDLALDSFVVSRLLAKVIEGLNYDLILTGVQADDDNCAAVGSMLAEHVGIAPTAVVTGCDPQNGQATIRVELEGGQDEISRIRLPALLTVQTGINEPRYVSIMGIRRAKKKPLDVVHSADLDLSAADRTPQTTVEEVFLPPETGGAEMIEGDPAAVAEQILRILSERGVNI